MPDHIRRFSVGDITVTIINIGDVQEDLNVWWKLTPEERAAHGTLFTQPARLPIQSIHLSAPGALSILVDAGAYDYPPDSPLLIPGYTPPPDLLTSLSEAGIDPTQITHVVITHAHGDHFNALTAPEGERITPVFPNARHYLGRGDWDKLQPELTDPASLESRTLGVLHERGQLELVAQETSIASGITILPAPGESPGHQVVRVQGGGQTLYCIGDLYHIPAEVTQGWMPPWNDPPTNQQSRATFNTRFVQEDALLIATHIADVGRLQETTNGYRWTPVRIS